ncbi:MAG: lyase family protein, partial [Planctomycetota bacterium]
MTTTTTMQERAETRIETDSMGEMTVPAHVLYGASTQRAVLNFPVSGRPLPPEVIGAFALLKKACAQTNLELGKLDEKRTELIIRACDEIIDALEGRATAFATDAAGLMEH